MIDDILFRKERYNKLLNMSVEINKITTQKIFKTTHLLQRLVV